MSTTTRRTARISIRKMGTRAGQPHYGATCTTCGSVLAVAHLSRDAAKSVGDAHKVRGCYPALMPAWIGDAVPGDTGADRPLTGPFAY